MLQPSSTSLETGARFLGELHPLMERLGSADGLNELAGVAAQFPRIHSLPTLRDFLQRFEVELLVPVELPAIYRAFVHASRYEVRELIALDQLLSSRMVLRDFASASQRVGKSQLRRLRPLRDQRLVQRYLQAVEKGEAHGWHTLVYGVILHIFSLPVRPGLMSYAHQTLRGFIESAARPLQLSEGESQALLEEVSAGLPKAIESLVADNYASPQSVALSGLS